MGITAYKFVTRVKFPSSIHSCNYIFPYHNCTHFQSTNLYGSLHYVVMVCLLIILEPCSYLQGCNKCTTHVRLGSFNSTFRIPIHASWHILLSRMLIEYTVIKLYGRNRAFDPLCPCLSFCPSTLIPFVYINVSI